MDDALTFSSRALGCILGGALGDTLGYPVEFWRAKEIAARFRETPKSLRYSGPEALFSDDTQMSLFTIDGIIRACVSKAVPEDLHRHIGRAYLRWLATQGGYRVSTSEEGRIDRLARLRAQRAPGMTCLRALHEYRSSGVLPTLHEPPANDSKGCGAVMRTAAIGIWCSDPHAAFQRAAEAGVITHAHPSGYLSGAYLASLISLLCQGAHLEDAMSEADAELARWQGCEELQDIIKKTRLVSTAATTPIRALGQGWVGEEALAMALLVAMTAETSSPQGLRDALWRASNHDGDSDSTASIAGNVLGAMVGIEALPADWLEELELRREIEQLVRDLLACKAGNESALSARDYPPA